MHKYFKKVDKLLPLFSPHALGQKSKLNCPRARGKKYWLERFLSVEVSGYISPIRSFIIGKPGKKTVKNEGPWSSIWVSNISLKSGR